MVTVLVAIITGTVTLFAERYRQRREQEKETASSSLLYKQAELSDEAAKRKEIDIAASEIRDFLRNRVAELDKAIDAIETTRTGEREKWHQMLGELSVKNLDLELQHRKDTARIMELEEEAAAIDDEVKVLRARIATATSDAIVMSAKLDQCKLECDRLRGKQLV